jgi:N4-gp56 family major capsid protein
MTVQQGIITNTSMPPELQLHFSQKLLATPYFNLIYSLGSDYHDAENHMGQNTRMRRYDPLSLDGGELDGSGFDPAPEVVNFADVDAKMEHFAKVLVVNDQVTMYQNDKVLNKFTILLGQWLNEKEDRLMRELHEGAASSINCTGGNNGDNPTEPSGSDLDDVEVALLGKDAKTILESIQATDQFSTSGNLDSFLALCSTDLVKDLKAIDDFKTRAFYAGDKDEFRKEEYGAYGRFRFFVSSKGSKEAGASLNGNTVYDIACKGMEAIAKLEQSLDTARVIYRDPYVVSTVEQNATLAARFSLARAISNQDWIILLKCTKA